MRIISGDGSVFFLTNEEKRGIFIVGWKRICFFETIIRKGKLREIGGRKATGLFKRDSRAYR